MVSSWNRSAADAPVVPTGEPLKPCDVENCDDCSTVHESGSKHGEPKVPLDRMVAVAADFRSSTGDGLVTMTTLQTSSRRVVREPDHRVGQMVTGRPPSTGTSSRQPGDRPAARYQFSATVARAAARPAHESVGEPPGRPEAPAAAPARTRRRREVQHDVNRLQTNVESLVVVDRQLAADGRSNDERQDRVPTPSPGSWGWRLAHDGNASLVVGVSCDSSGIRFGALLHQLLLALFDRFAEVIEFVTESLT